MIHGPMNVKIALQFRRPWVRFPIESVRIFIDIILPAALWP